MSIDRSFLLAWKASRNWTILSVLLTVIQGVFPILTLFIIKLIIDTVSMAAKNGDVLAYRLLGTNVPEYVVNIMEGDAKDKERLGKKAVACKNFLFTLSFTTSSTGKSMAGINPKKQIC